MFELPEGYNIVSDEEYADMIRESAEPFKFGSAGVIQPVPEQAPDAHLDDIEFLVDCE